MQNNQSDYGEVSKEIEKSVAGSMARPETTLNRSDSSSDMPATLPQRILLFFEKLLSISFPKLAEPPAYDILRWRDIIEWFVNWSKSHPDVTGDIVGFTFYEKAQDGEYVLVQGIFNKTSNNVEEARRIRANKVDDEVKSNCFGKEKVTIFS